MLDELLTSHFSRRDEVTWSLLTGDGGPLGSFSNKILAAYAFGIITDLNKSNIATVRHIRNASAHTMAPLPFSHAAIVPSRSEERRVGKECVGQCGARCTRY